VVLVDNGGFFPEDDLHEDAAWFLMDAMKMIGTDAVGVGERELRFGYQRVHERAAKDQLPMV